MVSTRASITASDYLVVMHFSPRSCLKLSLASSLAFEYLWSSVLIASVTLAIFLLDHSIPSLSRSLYSCSRSQSDRATADTRNCVMGTEPVLINGARFACTG